jgi:hypothetical protein
VSHASPFLNRLSIRPLVDREGQVIYYLGVLYDITDQVRTHEALEKCSSNSNSGRAAEGRTRSGGETAGAAPTA